MTSLSVIIPTYRRAKILTKTLDCISRQTSVNQLEAIVVSDGHDDETAALFTKKDRWNFPLTFLEIEKSQQGKARNEGVKKAKGDRVLFLGDDIFLEPDACEIHLAARSPKPAAILGFTTWDPSLIITPVMRWLEASGWQFGYPMIERYAGKEIPKDIQHRFSYTSHISLPKATAQSIPFREDLTMYGWEDIEWGLRLKDAGVPLVYEPRAKAFHHHPMTVDQSLRRMETLGKSAVTVEGIDPRLHIVPKGLKKIAYEILSLFPTLAGRHRAAFLRGITLG